MKVRKKLKIGVGESIVPPLQAGVRQEVAGALDVVIALRDVLFGRRVMSAKDMEDYFNCALPVHHSENAESVLPPVHFSFQCCFLPLLCPLLWRRMGAPTLYCCMDLGDISENGWS